MMHGGFVDAEPFDESHRRALEAIIDTLIPAEDGWPRAAEVGVADLIATYLVPADSPVSLYPHFSRAEFDALVERIGTELVPQQLDERVAALSRIEQAEPELFSRLRDFVYYAYYGHPEVVSLIRTTTRFGADYLGGGQPEGYVGSLETWGDRAMSARGAFFPTDAVRRAPQAKERA
jgi:hypothetical protein